MDQNTRDELRVLEESLWRDETRFDDELMGKLFAEDFCEFGRSGRRYSRQEMLLGQNGATEIHATLPLRDFCARYLSEDIVQVSYVSEVRYGARTELANRSSIWSRHKNGWTLRFHQGTPTTQAFIE